ncbi:hypothetical protein D3C72_1834620 [compost metagenome]
MTGHVQHVHQPVRTGGLAGERPQRIGIGPGKRGGRLGARFVEGIVDADMVGIAQGGVGFQHEPRQHIRALRDAGVAGVQRRDAALTGQVEQTILAGSGVGKRPCGIAWPFAHVSSAHFGSGNGADDNHKDCGNECSNLNYLGYVFLILDLI